MAVHVTVMLFKTVERSKRRGGKGIFSIGKKRCSVLGLVSWDSPDEIKLCVSQQVLEVKYPLFFQLMKLAKSARLG
jgi:hypothetical protein